MNLCQHYPNGFGARNDAGQMTCGRCGQGMTDDEVATFRRQLTSGEIADPTIDRMGLIGRDRILIDRLTSKLHAEAGRVHDHGPIRPTRRGASFDVMIRVEGEPTGHVARVTVELEPRND